MGEGEIDQYAPDTRMEIGPLRIAKSPRTTRRPVLLPTDRIYNAIVRA